MQFRTLLLATIAALPMALVSNPALATSLCDTPFCVPPTTTTIPGTEGLRSQWATRFSIGVQWNFGTERPELVAAVRRTETTAHSQVYGGQADATMPLSLEQPLQWPTLRILTLAGNRAVQGQLGLGVVTGSWAPLAAAGLQLPYTTGGVNYVLGSGFQPYFGVNAFARAVPPRHVGGPGSSSISCPAGSTLTNVAEVFGFVAVSAQANGQTCLTPRAA